MGAGFTPIRFRRLGADTGGGGGGSSSDADDDAAAIATEASNRDTAIGAAITTEASNRDTAIGAAITTEVTNRNTAISSAVSALAAAMAANYNPAQLNTGRELSYQIIADPGDLATPGVLPLDSRVLCFTLFDSDWAYTLPDPTGIGPTSAESGTTAGTLVLVCTQNAGARVATITPTTPTGPEAAAIQLRGVGDAAVLQWSGDRGWVVLSQEPAPAGAWQQRLLDLDFTAQGDQFFLGAGSYPAYAGTDGNHVIGGRTFYVQNSGGATEVFQLNGGAHDRAGNPIQGLIIRPKTGVFYGSSGGPLSRNTPLIGIKLRDIDPRLTLPNIERMRVWYMTRTPADCDGARPSVVFAIESKPDPAHLDKWWSWGWFLTQPASWSGNPLTSGRSGGFPFAIESNTWIAQGGGGTAMGGGVTGPDVIVFDWRTPLEVYVYGGQSASGAWPTPDSLVLMSIINLGNTSAGGTAALFLSNAEGVDYSATLSGDLALVLTANRPDALAAGCTAILRRLRVDAVFT